jgi:hypothetical protein
MSGKQSLTTDYNNYPNTDHRLLTTDYNFYRLPITKKWQGI